MDSLIENILKINTTDHLQIQWQIRKILRDLGFCPRRCLTSTLQIFSENGPSFLNG